MTLNGRHVTYKIKTEGYVAERKFTPLEEDNMGKFPGIVQCSLIINQSDIRFKVQYK